MNKRKKLNTHLLTLIQNKVSKNIIFDNHIYMNTNKICTMVPRIMPRVIDGLEVIQLNNQLIVKHNSNWYYYKAL